MDDVTREPTDPRDPFDPGPEEREPYPRKTPIWPLIVLLVIVNIAPVTGLLDQLRLDREGETVAATVLSAQPAFNGKYDLTFQFPPDVDERGQHWTVRLEEAPYEEAREAGSIEVTVLPTETAVWETEGQIDSPIGTILPIIGNVLVLGALVLVLARRRRQTPGGVARTGRMEP